MQEQDIEPKSTSESPVTEPENLESQLAAAQNEIEELKENLERKEYLLQVNEQKYSEFEKMLMQVADYDDGVRRRLEDMNVVPKDRKISNVVLENA